ncbi:MAG: GGDEF domain-containing protein [Patescibacteria group bacterium]|nr:GGDEF domain-containing protein [Patescibacteria group bacterium]
MIARRDNEAEGFPLEKELEKVLKEIDECLKSISAKEDEDALKRLRELREDLTYLGIELEKDGDVDNLSVVKEKLLEIFGKLSEVTGFKPEEAVQGALDDVREVLEAVTGVPAGQASEEELFRCSYLRTGDTGPAIAARKMITGKLKDRLLLDLKDRNNARLKEENLELGERAIRAPLIGKYGFLDRDAGEEEYRKLLERYFHAEIRWRDVTGEIKKGIRRKEKPGEGLAVLMVDLDKFGHTNNTLGHQIGDEVLKGTASIMGRRRPGDICIRYGGEELMVVLDDVTFKEATKIAEDIRREIAVDFNAQLKEMFNDAISVAEDSIRKLESQLKRLNEIADGSKIYDINVQLKEFRRGKSKYEKFMTEREEEFLLPSCVSASIGVSFFPDVYKEGDSLEDVAKGMIKVADDALYQAKESGRDGVVCITHDPKNPDKIIMRRITEVDRDDMSGAINVVSMEMDTSGVDITTDLLSISDSGDDDEDTTVIDIERD